jgi:hypothetical protein
VEEKENKDGTKDIFVLGKGKKIDQPEQAEGFLNKLWHRSKRG